MSLEKGVLRVVSYESERVSAVIIGEILQLASDLLLNNVPISSLRTKRNTLK